MKTNFKLTSRFLMVLLCLVAIACSKDETTDPPEVADTDQDGVIDTNDDCPNEAGPASNNGCPTTTSATTLAEVVASGDAFESFPPNTTETEVAGTETTRDDKFDRKESSNGPTIEQRWVCTEKEVDITGGTQTFPLYNTNASVIWPGNLLQGKTLDNATPADIVVKRAGGTITYNLVTGNPVATVAVDIVDQGTVQQAMNNIIAQNGDITPANFTLDVVAVNSSEQLALEMGLKASTLTTKVSSDFSLDTSSETSSVLVKLTQQYYTMSYVKPTSLDEVFDPSVTPEQLATFIQPDNPGTFISSVTYGRIFYMLYESTASAEDMEFALKGSYNVVAGSASASVDIESLREYNNLTVKVIAYGGDSQGTLNAVGATFGGDEAVDNLQDIVGRLAESSDISGGLPLSYVVNSLEDPSQVVSTNLATRYTVKNCELKGVLPPTLYSDLLDLFEDGIGAMVNVKDSDVLVFNRAGTNYAWFNGNTSSILGDSGPKIYDISDPNAPLGDVGLEGIGAGTVSRVDLSAGFQIALFSTDGIFAEFFNIDNSKIPGNALPNGMIGTYVYDNIRPINDLYGDSGNFIIGTDGFEAAVRVGGTSQAYFGKPGDKYQVYDVPFSGSAGIWENPKATDMWFGDQVSIDNNGALFERVSAATNFTLGGGSTRYLFVNEEGTEIMEWFSSTTVGEDKFEGPWVIN